MAIKTAPQFFIDVTGPDGNALVLLAYANKLASQLGMNTQKITHNMMAGTYEELLEIFEKLFDHVVTLNV